MYATPLQGGEFSIGVSEEQAEHVIELLQTGLKKENTDMRELRGKFYDEEGYMVSDDYLRNYYGKD